MQGKEMEPGLRGAQKLPEPREGAPPRAGAGEGGGLRRPQTEAAARRPSELRRRGGARGEEGRAAGPLRASPGRAGLPRPPGSRERAGRTQGEVSSCFPWLRRGGGGEGGWDAGPGPGRQFFSVQASPRPPGGARACGRAEAGGRSPPQMPAPPEPAAAAALGAFQRALTWDAGRPAGFLRAGRRGRVGAGHRGWGRTPGPGRVTRPPGGQVGLEPRPLSPFPASLAQAGGSPPQSRFSLVPVHSPLRRGSKRGHPLARGSVRGPEEDRKNKAGDPASLPTPSPQMASWCPPCPHPLRLVWPGWRGWWGWLGPQTLWNRQGLSSGPGPLPRLTAGRRGVLLEGPGG